MKNFKYLILIIALAANFKSFGQNTCNFRTDSFDIITKKDFHDLITNLESQKFQTSKDKKEIPAVIKNQLICLTKDSFSIANPDEAYRCCCMSPRELPARKLLLFLKNKDFFVIAYLTGGMGVSTTVDFFKLQNEIFVDSWTGKSFNDFKSQAEIIKFMKSLDDPIDMQWLHRTIK